MSRKQKLVEASYKEASSDDEYAKANFMFPSSDNEKEEKDLSEDNNKKRGRGRKSKKTAENDVNEKEESIQYRIQHILGRKLMTPAEWREISDGKTTRELTKGSVWEQPDEEYYDPSEIPLEKFFIKWSHCSFLHCSWETEKDLLDNIGQSVKAQIKKFRAKEMAGGIDLFEDLSKGEYFPFSFLQIERILDADDKSVDIRTLKWETVRLPPILKAPIKKGKNIVVIEEEEGNENKEKEAENMEEVEQQQDKEEQPHSDSSEDSDNIWNSDSDDEEEGEGDAEDNEEEGEQEEEDDEEEEQEEEEDEEDAADGDANEENEEVEEEDEESPNRQLRPRKTFQSSTKELASSDEEFDVDVIATTRPTRSKSKRIIHDTEEVEEPVDEEDTDNETDKKKRKRKQPMHTRKKTRRQGGRRSSKKSLSGVTSNGKKMRQTTLAATKSSKKLVCKRKLKNEFLHGDACWVTVKWEGLPYSDVSFESLQDIIYSNLDYENALRAFYRREQRIYELTSATYQRSHAFDLKGVDTTALSSPTPPTFPGGTLRDYQWEGVRWMLYNFINSRNCILADEMGLGKTIQSATLLQMLKRLQPNSGPFLIIAPLSTIVNWQREINAWTNLDVILYYGSQEDRELIRSYEFKYLDEKNAKKKKKGCAMTFSTMQEYKVEVVITTPETSVAYDENPLSNTTGRAPRLRRELSKIPWDVIIIDEAHKLKNYDSKLSSTLREEYAFHHCVLLTGTPLQNNTDELWTLLHFVASNAFGSREDFSTQFGDLKTAKQLENLHGQIKPYLLRREKEFVEKTVPPKEEIVIEVELTVPQKQYYRAIYEQKTNFLYKQGAKDGPSLTNLAMELRKCCNHPFLIKGALHELSKHFVNDTIHNILIKTSGKMTLLDKLLPKLYQDQHRVLIFSQFRSMLDIIEDYLHDSGFFYERVDGSIVGKKRQASIDRYMNNPNIFIMLLSTRAGGVGINLTAADTVIIYDSDWNPQNDIQAQARAHRIGQTKPVTVYRLLTRKSYEMVMFRAASIKLGLDYAIMHNLQSSGPAAGTQLQLDNKRSTRRTASALAGVSTERADHASALSKKELENLLKHGAYDIFLEEKEGTSEQESTKFVEASIESILAHSSIFVHQENANERQVVRGNTFAKASFVSSTGNTEEGQDIAIDDPEFWNKVVCLSVEEQESGIGGKRKCRQQVESYKEPSMSITGIYGSRSNAYITDSDDSSDEQQQRPVKRKRKDDIVPAIYSIDNLQAILAALVNHGYGQWSTIRKVSKMYWTNQDIAKACRGIILYLWLTSYVPVAEKVVSKTTNITEPTDTTTETNLEVVEEESVVDGEMTKEAKEKESKPTTVTESATATAVTAVATTTSPYDWTNLHSSWLKFKATKMALKLFLAHDCTTKPQVSSEDDIDMVNPDLATMDDILQGEFFSVLETKGVPLDTITPQTMKELFDQFMVIHESWLTTTSSVPNTAQELLTIPIQQMEENAILNAFLLADRMEQQQQQPDPGKNAKRAVNNRSKLQQIEDLFELSWLYKMMVRVEEGKKVNTNTDTAMMDVAPLVVADTVEDTEDAAAVHDDEASEQNNEKEDTKATTKPPAVFTYLTGSVEEWTAYVAKVFTQATEKELSPCSNPLWTSMNDLQLLQTVIAFGWPEGKRRLTNILEALLPCIAGSSTASTTVAATESNTATTTENKADSTHPATTTDTTVVDVVEGSMNNDGMTSTTVNTPVSAPASSTVTSKFLLQRTKLFAKLLRGLPPEEVIIKPSKSAAAAALKEKQNEKTQRKKQLTALLKTIQRIGYPRSVYSSSLSSSSSAVVNTEVTFQKKSYWLTYEELLHEANIPIEQLSVSEVQDIIHTLIDYQNRAEEFEKTDLIPQLTTTQHQLLFEDISWKLIDHAFEKSETIHHIRCLLTLQSEQELFEAIKTNCKQTGPNIPPYKRDQTMPVWWTLSHDLTLFSVVLQHGMHQWKKVSTDPLILSPPEDFVLPPKVNGQEWVTVLTPKNAEKRITSLFRGLPTLRTLSIPLPPPTSPQKTRNLGDTMTTNNSSGTLTTGGKTFSNTNTKSMSSWFQSNKTVVSKTTSSASTAVAAPATPATPIATTTSTATATNVVIEDKVDTVKDEKVVVIEPCTTTTIKEDNNENEKQQQQQQKTVIVIEEEPVVMPVPAVTAVVTKKEEEEDDVIILVDETAAAPVVVLPPTQQGNTVTTVTKDKDSTFERAETTTSQSSGPTTTAAHTTPTTPTTATPTTTATANTTSNKPSKSTKTSTAAGTASAEKKGKKATEKKVEAVTNAASTSKSILSFFKKS